MSGVFSSCGAVRSGTSGGRNRRAVAAIVCAALAELEFADLPNESRVFRILLERAGFYKRIFVAKRDETGVVCVRLDHNGLAG